MITMKQHFTIMLKVNKIMDCILAMTNKVTEGTSNDLDNFNRIY